MYKKIAAATLSAALLIPVAASAEQAALPAGKPAGVKAAAMHAPMWVWIAGIGFVALGIALATSGGSGNSGGASTGTGVL